MKALLKNKKFLATVIAAAIVAVVGTNMEPQDRAALEHALYIALGAILP